MFSKASIFTAIALSFFAIEKTFASCSSYPTKEGLTSEIVEGGIKIISTTQVKVLSDNPEDVMNALGKAKQLSTIQIRRFISQGPGENNYFQGTLKGVVQLGSCYEPKKYVRVTLGISPKTINKAK